MLGASDRISTKNNVPCAISASMSNRLMVCFGLGHGPRMLGRTWQQTRVKQPAKVLLEPQANPGDVAIGDVACK